MPARCIVLLRHAEKPTGDGRAKGVDARGEADDNELSVRGWQRAGALACFFAADRGELGVPDALFAGAPTREHPSRRSISTLEPLAQRLGLALETSFQRGCEPTLAHAAAQRDGLVLVAWDHRGLCSIANALMDSSQLTPQSWPDGCFDRFWVFHRQGTGWRYEEQAQRLLGRDA